MTTINKVTCRVCRGVMNNDIYYNRPLCEQCFVDEAALGSDKHEHVFFEAFMEYFLGDDWYWR